MYYLYCVINTVNGKKYIGKSHDVNARWKQHVYGSECGSDLYFHRALRAHGVQSFKLEVLDTVNTEEEAYGRERELIQEHCTNDPEFGYNMNEGGVGGGTPSEAVRQKMRDAWTKRRQTYKFRHSEESKAKMRAAAEARPPVSEVSRKKNRLAHLGKTASLETRQKLSVSNRGRKLDQDVIDRISGPRGKYGPHLDRNVVACIKALGRFHEMKPWQVAEIFGLDVRRSRLIMEDKAWKNVEPCTLEEARNMVKDKVRSKEHGDEALSTHSGRKGHQEHE